MNQNIKRRRDHLRGRVVGYQDGADEVIWGYIISISNGYDSMHCQAHFCHSINYYSAFSNTCMQPSVFEGANRYPECFSIEFSVNFSLILMLGRSKSPVTLAKVSVIYFMMLFCLFPIQKNDIFFI